MVEVCHIQYPVGQGGLHLGIIDDYAYIYDCGGYGRVSWKNIFTNVKNKLGGVNKLDIFISHLHQDHYNKLEQLLNAISLSTSQITVYIPFMDEWEKVILLTEYFLKRRQSGNQERNKAYINDVLYNLRNDKYRNVEVIPIRSDRNHENIASGLLLRTYVTKLAQSDVDRFKNEAQNYGIDIDNLFTQIANKNFDFWKRAKQVFKNVFGKNYSVNQIMLNLYCGLEYSCRCYSDINWLHTGDACMKKTEDLLGYYNNFKYLLKNVNFVQIPHHSSKNNHDWKFSFLFNCNCCFYYTTKDKKGNSKKITVPYTNDLNLLPCQHISAISDTPSTKIELLRKV